METGEEVTLGLRKKNQECDLQYYVSLKGMHAGPQTTQLVEIFIQELMNNFKEYPEEYFNFGFNYNDFKAFLLKLVWMRSQRRFFERNLKDRFHYSEGQYGMYRQNMDQDDDNGRMM